MTLLPENTIEKTWDNHLTRAITYIVPRIHNIGFNNGQLVLKYIVQEANTCNK